MKALCAIFALLAVCIGCGPPVSEEENERYLRENDPFGRYPESKYRNPLGIVGGQAFSDESLMRGTGEDIDKETRHRMRWKHGNWVKKTPTALIIHGNACKQWTFHLEPAPNTWAGQWRTKYLDEKVKPAAKQNLKDVMRYDDGRTVQIHCWDIQYR